MTEASKILLQGGTVLQHTHNNQVKALYDTDLLIEGDTISRIGKNIQADSNTHVIDCKGKIISPGFVDTHHHVWQTQLKGGHSDDTLLDYHPKGNLQYFNYTPEDIFWGELGGLLEAIDGGTTTIVDHAHLSKTPDHVFAGISATIATKIRSIFCYSLVPNIKRWDNEFELGSPPIPEWFFPTFDKVARTLKSTQGRVGLGFGFDNYHLPKEDVKKLYGAAREHGATTITSHWRRNNIAADDNFSIPKILQDYDLLDEDVLLSHGTGSTEQEFRVLKKAGAWVSATPATESQMAHGDVVAFKDGVLAAMGSDCHSNNPGTMLHTMQIGLAVARSHRNSDILAQGKFPLQIEPTTLHAFNLATVCGALAIGKGDQIGSLQEGKKADVIIFDTSSPAMACVPDENPLVAVVRHATPADIDTVIIGGHIVKQNGKLKDLIVPSEPVWDGVDGVGKGQSLSWLRIAEKLRESRVEIQRRIDKCNIQAAREAVIKMWGMPNTDNVLV